MKHKNLSKIQDNDGNTPLHLMAEHAVTTTKKINTNHKDIAKVKNNNGQTPLHILAKGGYDFYNPEQNLIKNPKISKVKDKKERTPLHYLSSEEALQHPDVDKVKDWQGNTPLHIMALRGFPPALQHKSSGTSFTSKPVKNNYGQTPKDIFNQGFSG